MAVARPTNKLRIDISNYDRSAIVAELEYFVSSYFWNSAKKLKILQLVQKWRS